MRIKGKGEALGVQACRHAATNAGQGVDIKHEVKKAWTVQSFFTMMAHYFLTLSIQDYLFCVL